LSRGWKVAAAAWLAVFIIVGQAHASELKLTPGERHDRVRYETLERPQWTLRETRLTIIAAAHRFGVSSSLMLCVAQRESGLNEDAVNGYSGAAGLFQHLRSYWPGRVRAYNSAMPPLLDVKRDASPFSARANALVSARMMRSSLSPWGGGC
jgi:hypothetical protein